MAGNGLMYIASFNNLSVTNAAQDLWQVTAATTASVLIHSVRVTFTPTITSGVAQDARFTIGWALRTAAGAGGTAATTTTTGGTQLAPVNKRNSTAPVSTWTRQVTTINGVGNTLTSDNVSVIVPYERIYTPDQRIVLPAAASGSYLGLWLATAPGAAYSCSTEIYFEEI